MAVKAIIGLELTCKAEIARLLLALLPLLCWVASL